jgi:hypothetical protein
MMKKLIAVFGNIFCLVGCLVAIGGSLGKNTHMLASGLLLVVAALPIMIPATMQKTISKLERRIAALEAGSKERKESCEEEN